MTDRRKPDSRVEQEFDLFEDTMRDVTPLTPRIAKSVGLEAALPDPVDRGATAPKPVPKPAPETPKLRRVILSSKLVGSKVAPPKVVGQAPGLARSADLAADVAAHKTGRYPGLDGRSARRLKRGEIRVEERLDLHGMTRDEAESTLAGFIATRRGAGLRCVLIITGKGDRRPAGNARNAGSARPAGSFGGFGDENAGVLRRMAPHWLSSPPISDHVIAFAAAQPRDGGGGALYVLLKKAGR